MGVTEQITSKLFQRSVSRWQTWEEKSNYPMGFEVLTEVSIKITVFRDVTLCHSVDVIRRFGRNHGRNIHVTREGRVENNMTDIMQTGA
jgi:hypothetical protein